jgi:endoplasmic reticulum Man9GlcNAc2 1,2-alpha-mannosidase
MTPKLPTSNSEFLIPSVREVQFKADVPKREAVKQAFQHAWSEYETHAFGADEYHPISKKGSNMTKAGGIGYTVVDSIDTMMLMGLDEEYARARSWIKNDLSFDRDGLYNTFEVRTVFLHSYSLGATCFQ